MPRKTRRLGKKKRNRTHNKRKGVKITRKYKILKGGLGPNDYENIGIKDTFIFQDGCKQLGGGGDYSKRQEKIIEFKNYVFGSARNAQLWEEILQLCFDKSIPFYILTSGSKVGIIRTLQLLELSEYVTEVLCNNPSDVTNPNINDVDDRNEFKKMNKYQIIECIIKNRLSKGIFVDNDKRNSENSELCPNIAFKYAEGSQDEQSKVVAGSQDEQSKGVTGSRDEESKQRIYSTKFSSFVNYLSPLYGSPIPNFSTTLYDKTRSNFVYGTVLLDIKGQITEDNDNDIRFVFADFDGTMSPWRGALPFHIEDFNKRFFSHFNVVTL